MKVLLPIAENLISEPKTTLQPKIDRYAAPIAARGHTVEQVTIPLSLTVPQVAAIIHNRMPDGGAVELFGGIPAPQVFQGLDGHGYRPGDEDLYYTLDPSKFPPNPDGTYYLPWPVPQIRMLGRIDFSGLNGTDYYGDNIGDEFALTSAWLDWHHAVTTGQASFDNKSVMVDILDYMMPELGSRLIADLESVTGPGTVLDTRNGFPFKQFFQTYSGRTFLAAALYDGGEPFIVGEYNTGSLVGFASGLVKMCLTLIFCSNAWQTEKWPLQRAALVGGSLAVVYGTWAPPALGKWSETVSIGEAIYDSFDDSDNDDALFTVIGDVMLLKPISTGGDDLSQAQVDAINARFDKIEGRLTALEGDSTTKGPPPPPDTNYCAAANGGRATASSSFPGGQFGADKAINGITALNAAIWSAGGGWNSETNTLPSEWLQVLFAAVQTINHVVVYGVPDGYDSASVPIEPNDTMIGSKYLAQDFTLECLVNGSWQTLAVVTGNNLVKRTIAFADMANVSGVRVNITKAQDNWKRVVEIQAFEV